MKDWTKEDIRALRNTYKLTRKALGELLGVTVSSIYQWEREVKKPSKTTKILLSRIEDDFLKSEKNEKGKESDSHGKKSKRSL